MPETGSNENGKRMSEQKAPIKASDAPARTKPSNYPEPYASRMTKRIKQPLGDYFGITQYGVKIGCHALRRCCLNDVSAGRFEFNASLSAMARIAQRCTRVESQ